MSDRLPHKVWRNGEPLKLLELFFASGVSWVRYMRPDGEWRYATVDEWREWEAA